MLRIERLPNVPWEELLPGGALLTLRDATSNAGAVAGVCPKHRVAARMVIARTVRRMGVSSRY
jgi:hypothetical protein